tara:strand:- start:593 stop:1258 length:666 start_codon:yes stop_codon:yes gene_type:complete
MTNKDIEIIKKHGHTYWIDNLLNRVTELETAPWLSDFKTFVEQRSDDALDKISDLESHISEMKIINELQLTKGDAVEQKIKNIEQQIDPANCCENHISFCTCIEELDIPDKKDLEMYIDDKVGELDIPDKDDLEMYIDDKVEDIDLETTTPILAIFKRLGKLEELTDKVGELETNLYFSVNLAKRVERIEHLIKRVQRELNGHPTVCPPYSIAADDKDKSE